MLKLLEGVLSFLYASFYFVVRLFIVKKTISGRTCKYYFSVCSIFKDEAPFLKEFIEYHYILGVEHIYLYNNNSSDNYLEVLQPYLDNGFVTLVDWEKNFAQAEAYKNCYDNAKDETFWLAFIDIDEFIVPYKETDVKDFIKRFEEFPVVTLYWKIFGTGGIIQRDPEKLVTEQFTVSWARLDGIGKCILNTSPCFYFPKIGVHRTIAMSKWCNRTIKIPPVTEWKKFIFLPQIYEAPMKNTIQLNHYWSKAFEDFSKKINKGDVASEENIKLRQKEEFFYSHESRNIVDDKTVFRFLIKLKIRMSSMF